MMCLEDDLHADVRKTVKIVFVDDLELFEHVPRFG